MKITNLKGKGGRLRTITVPAWVEAELWAWLTASRVDQGRVLRSFHPDGTVNGSLSPTGVYAILKRYSAALGIPIAPHDARRTMARLARDGGATVECIQHTLGHASAQTTARYINSTEAANAGEFIKL